MGQSNKSGQRNPNNPPNPRNGQSMVPYNPALKYTEEDFKRFQNQARRQARECLLMELGITDLCAVTTPSSRWFVEADGKDSFPEMINQERGSLCLGNHTDDELAAELFLYGDMSAEDKHRAMMSGKPMSLAYLMAGKERIRWLSRHLESSLSREGLLLEQIQGLRQLVLDFGFELPDPFLPGTDEHSVSYANGANYMRNEFKGKLGFDYHHKDPADGSKAEIPIIRDLKNGMETVIRDKHGCSGIVRPLSIPADKEPTPQVGAVTKFNPSADFNTSLQMAIIMLQGTPEQQQEALQFLGGLVGKITLKEKSDVPSD